MEKPDTLAADIVPGNEPVPPAPNAVPEDAVWEGGFAFWLEGTAPDLHIWCAGAGQPFEVHDHNTWYPDELYARREQLLQAASA